MNLKSLHTLQRLAAAIPGAIIAGGAVRDGVLGIPLRDIDIVMPASTDAQVDEALTAVNKATKRLLKPVTVPGGGYEESYLLFRSPDSKVELILTKTPSREHINTFHDDISRMYVDAQGLHIRPEALSALASKKVDAVNASPVRVAKLKAKLEPLGFEVISAA